MKIRIVKNLVRAASRLLMLAAVAALNVRVATALTVTQGTYYHLHFPATPDIPIDPDDPSAGVIPGDPEFIYYARGEYSNRGTTPAVGITFIGQSGNTYDEVYAAFLGFDLGSLAGRTADSAKLRLELESYYGNDPYENFTVHDVSATSTDLIRSRSAGDPVGQAIFNDLSSGATYGSGRFDKNGPKLVEIDLSSALADINALLNAGVVPKRFFVGLSLDQITVLPGEGRQEGLRFSAGNEYRTHELVLHLVPEAGATLGLLGLSSTILAVRRRARLA